LSSFVWWLAGNVAYGALALTAAGVRVAGRPAEARIFAAAGTGLFVVSNGAALVLACSSGGACGTVAGIVAVFLVFEILLVVADHT
jgi:hypothetical protein